eukprot:TRINITY_DN3227_c3_g6_i1.p1 TRINITY_DN3227_c3_g6~~TRINITY_DN3227_c3_g6_i1.p1  ORF type:complete len:249 (-),score=67.18 TRINITY_DN3227_c3_g6_i1:2-748(-)
MNDTNQILDNSVGIYVFLPILLLAFSLSFFQRMITNRKTKKQSVIETKSQSLLNFVSKFLKNSQYLPDTQIRNLINWISNDEGPLKRMSEEIKENEVPLQNTPGPQGLFMFFSQGLMIGVIIFINKVFPNQISVVLPFNFPSGSKHLIHEGLKLTTLPLNYLSATAWYFLCSFSANILLKYLVKSNTSEIDAQQMTMMANNPLAALNPGQKYLDLQKKVKDVSCKSRLSEIETTLLDHIEKDLFEIKF